MNVNVFARGSMRMESELTEKGRGRGAVTAGYSAGLICLKRSRKLVSF